ncbi:anti-sigma factor domain-containing protein [Pseudomonas canadensis]|uniref:anti-sigma factor domain-containing protein n=1 Tax=Pseudomonas canadensis TaxID=915099 RepID=UPI0030DC66C3
MNYQTTACAVVVAVTVGVLYQRDISAPYNVTLINASQQPALQIKAFADHLQVEPETLAAIEPTRSLELWALPEGGKPVSLGLLPEDGKGIIGLNPRQQASISEPVELLVSSETKGGSLSKEPTGPMIYQGALAVR